MLDIKFIRENPDVIRKDLEKRQDKERLNWLDELLEKDKEYRKLLHDIEQLRKRRNELSSKINDLKKQGKDASKELDEAKSVPDKLKKADERLSKVKENIDFYLMRIPNILHESVPFGNSEEDNKVIKEWGEPKKFDFELKPHGDIIQNLDVGDFKQAAKISGAGFYYLKGEMALLEQALIRFVTDTLTKKGWESLSVPVMLGRKAYEGVTDLADFEDVMYKIEGEDLYLVATSEHPICALHYNSVLDETELPKKYLGFSPCFRKEIGSHGVDTRGIYRVHQFNKVEQFVFCNPKDSWKFHEEMLVNAEEIFQALELPYRIVNICTGDIGIVAAKKYDLEVWLPRQSKYGEAVSCSNCTAYQAVRSNIRYQEHKGGREHVHTLNSTAIATSRALVAIIENYQNADGTVSVPSVLLPYMPCDVIKKK